MHLYSALGVYQLHTVQPQAPHDMLIHTSNMYNMPMKQPTGAIWDSAFCPKILWYVAGGSRPMTFRWGDTNATSLPPRSVLFMRVILGAEKQKQKTSNLLYTTKW